MLILGIFMGMTTLIMFRVLGESAAQRGTLAGVQQAQLAERTFTQDLRSGIANSISISSSGDDLVLAADVGTTTSSGVVSPDPEGLEAELCPTSNSTIDSLEVIFGLPTTTTTSGNSTTTSVTAIHECIDGPESSWTCPVSTSCTIDKTLPTGTRLTQAFDIQAPSSPIFSFYTLTTTLSETETKPELSQMDIATANANPTTIQAIGLSATFEPAPGSKVAGYSAELGTQVQTVAFLRNEEGTSE